MDNILVCAGMVGLGHVQHMSGNRYARGRRSIVNSIVGAPTLSSVLASSAQSAAGIVALLQPPLLLPAAKAQLLLKDSRTEIRWPALGCRGRRGRCYVNDRIPCASAGTVWSVRQLRHVARA